ncbi:MAG: hypothetical protein ACRDN0_19225 [Trebonia sp.]
MSESAVGVRVRPPLGSVFGLGWLLAELFDDQRQQSVTTRQPPFDAALQLPLVAELDRPDRLNFLMILLGDLLLPFPHLSNEQIKAGLDADPAPAAQAQSTQAQPEQAQSTQAQYKDALRALHLEILDELADEQEQLNAYQLGLALSDMCWLPAQGSGPDVFIEAFSRGQVAGLKALLDGAGAAIPPDTAAIVGKSLENWQDWIDVNAAKMKLSSATAWGQDTNPVAKALRIQGAAWHSVLTDDPDVSVQPGLGGWAHAAAAVARAARVVTFTILSRFWPLVLVCVAALALLLYLVVSNLSGASQAWASLATVGAFVGGGSFTLGTGVARSFGGIGSEVWAAAKLDAQAWNVTWLPAMPQTITQRAQLGRRGVAMPQLYRNLDA